MATPQQVMADYHQLQPEEQKQVQQQVGLGRPTRRVASTIWLMIVVALIVLVLGGAFAIYQMESHIPTLDSKVVVGLVTTSLGALIGLIAPSPVTQSGQ